jgi:hypothetical protein
LHYDARTYLNIACGRLADGAPERRRAAQQLPGAIKDGLGVEALEAISKGLVSSKICLQFLQHGYLAAAAWRRESAGASQA